MQGCEEVGHYVRGNCGEEGIMCKKTGVGQGAAEATMSEKGAVKSRLGKKTMKKRAPCARILRRGGASCARRLRRTRHHVQEKTEKGRVQKQP